MPSSMLRPQISHYLYFSRPDFGRYQLAFPGCFQSTYHHCNFPFICGVISRMAASPTWTQPLKARAMSISLIVAPFTHCMYLTDIYLWDVWAWSRFIQSQGGLLHFQRKRNMVQLEKFGKGSFIARCCSSFDPTCLPQGRCFINTYIEGLNTLTPSCPALSYLWSSALQSWEQEWPWDSDLG